LHSSGLTDVGGAEPLDQAAKQFSLFGASRQRKSLDVPAYRRKPCLEIAQVGEGGNEHGAKHRRYSKIRIAVVNHGPGEVGCFMQRYFASADLAPARNFADPANGRGILEAQPSRHPANVKFVGPGREKIRKGARLAIVFDENMMRRETAPLVEEPDVSHNRVGQGIHSAGVRD
jgi:hypothetical protein